MSKYTTCDYCTRLIGVVGGGRTNHLFKHARQGYVKAEAHRDRYVFHETPKGKKLRLGLRRAARTAAKAGIPKRGEPQLCHCCGGISVDCNGKLKTAKVCWECIRNGGSTERRCSKRHGAASP